MHYYANDGVEDKGVKGRGWWADRERKIMNIGGRTQRQKGNEKKTKQQQQQRSEKCSV